MKYISSQQTGYSEKDNYFSNSETTLSNFMKIVFKTLVENFFLFLYLFVNKFIKYTKVLKDFLQCKLS